MSRHVLTIAFMSTLAFGAGCASTTINATPGTPDEKSESGGPIPAGRGCSASNTVVAPANGLIANFDDATKGIAIPGAIITYAEPKVGGPSAPTYSISNGALNIKVNAAPTTTPQSAGLEVQFNSCMDASAFTGVRFTIRGAFSGCALQYAIGDVEHQDVTTGAPLATGAPGSYPHQSRIAAEDLTSEPRTITAPFAHADIKGNPSKATDATKLIYVLWFFIVPVATEGDGGNQACTGDITIDDIRFYR